MKMVLFGISIIVLCVGLGSCAKLQEEESVSGKIQFLDAQLTDSIPAEYGRLVGVTSSDSYRGWAQLWFEKDDKSIVMVAVDFINGEMRQKVTIIPRS